MEFCIDDGVLWGFRDDDDDRHTRITVPHGVRVIGEEAFADNEFLYHVALPDTVERIERERARHSQRAWRLHGAGAADPCAGFLVAKCVDLQVSVHLSTMRAVLTLLHDDTNDAWFRPTICANRRTRAK